MKPVVAIFAHPDDEAFGPSGTLAQFAKERDVYIICVTDGSEGLNSGDKTRELSEMRKEELLASAKLLGIKKVFFLGYKDGSLSNNLYHDVAEKIQKILGDLQPECLITYDMRGLSGHLDHIALSFISTYVFEQLSFINELWYFCITKQRRDLVTDYYIYFPPGYKKEEIDKTVNISDVWDLKIQAMQQHASQIHDVEKNLKAYGELPKEENFLVKKRVNSS
jgi:LmbE family N-acetylglucosaminyl deacetylase